MEQADYIEYIQQEWKPGTNEYANIIQMYAGLFNDNGIEGYADLAHRLIKNAALCQRQLDKGRQHGE